MTGCSASTAATSGLTAASARRRPGRECVVRQHGHRDRLLGHPSVEDRLDEVVDRHPEHLHRGLLVLEREVPALAPAQPTGEEEDVPLRRDTRRRPQGEQLPPVGRLELDLLAQLTLRGLDRFLSLGVAQPRRQLEVRAESRMPVLPHARHPLVVVDGQHDDRARVLEDPAVEGLLALGNLLGSADRVLAERDDPLAAVEVLRGFHRPGLRRVRPRVAHPLTLPWQA